MPSKYYIHFTPFSPNIHTHAGTHKYTCPIKKEHPILSKHNLKCVGNKYSQFHPLRLFGYVFPSPKVNLTVRTLAFIKGGVLVEFEFLD